MALSDVFSRVVEEIGEAAIVLRGQDGRKVTQAFGANPSIPAAKPQGNLPTLKMPTARGWPQGKTPTVAPGLKVNAFATGLKHPRWICVLPNGDVLAAEALLTPEPASSLFDYAMFSTLKRAAAMGESPNRITLLRDADGDGVAETKNAFLERQSQPFGMALVGDTFYVGNTDGVVAFPYTTGATRITEPGRKLTTHNGGGHWTRSLLLSPDKTKLYIGVGSLTNIADKGMEIEQGRAAIHELDLGERQEPHLRFRLAQSCGPRLGAADRRALDGGQRARRPRRRDAARLPHLGSRRRLLRLALLLLGQDGRRPRAARRGVGRERNPAGLRARRTHGLARALLAARRRSPRLSRGHGDRAARLLEPEHAERLQGHLRAVRERTSGRTVARDSERVSRARRAVLIRATRRAWRWDRTARSWSPTTSAM